MHEQWREQHQASRYPFSDSASLVTTEGVAIAIDTLLDAQIYPIGGTSRMYLSSVVVGSAGVTLYIGTVAAPALCSTTFDPLSPPDNLRLEDSYGRAAGILISETLRLARFQAWAVGTHTFERSSTEFAAAVCVPTPEIGIRGLVTEAGDLFTGDIWILGEDGVVVREDPVESTPEAPVIRVDVVGDPLFRRALCQGTAESPIGAVELFEAVNYLQTINNMPPDAFGDFKITGGSNEAVDSILRVYPTPDGLRFEAVGQKTIA
jgi:hypothetical protein